MLPHGDCTAANYKAAALNPRAVSLGKERVCLAQGQLSGTSRARDVAWHRQGLPNGQTCPCQTLPRWAIASLCAQASGSSPQACSSQPHFQAVLDKPSRASA
jgi:hypothetical protein